jgi:molybdopterin/thiamine biosynthesis adenylyltransferase
MNGPFDHDANAVDPSLADRIASLAASVHIPGTRDSVPTLDHSQILALHRQSGHSVSCIHRTALTRGVLPLCYLRNCPALSLDEQLRLAMSTVAVVGAGGLGGQVLVTLARVGIGRLIVIDPGRFEESNLNRQALCTHSSLGRTKAQTAQNVLYEINPGVEVSVHPLRLNPANCTQLIAPADIAVDALDSIEDRFVLQKGCRTTGIPLVHAAIDGFFGQLMTIFPQDEGLASIYGPKPSSPSASLGNPAMTAASLATLQAMEVLKIILGRGQLMRHTMLTLELEKGLLEQLSFS